MSSKFIWKNLSEEENEKRKQFWGENSTARDPVISVPNNVIMPKWYAAIADRVYNFKVRPDDIWIVTYPKCGTTWTQEIVWHIMNDVNKELGQAPLHIRSPFLEFEGIHPKGIAARLRNMVDEKQLEQVNHIFDNTIDLATNAISPRIIKSHMPLEFLPPNLLDNIW